MFIMSNLNRSAFQGHPFHLVSPSPWPIFTCISLLTLTTSGVLTMHGFSNAGYWLPLALALVMSSMFFWFRDVISEGRAKSLSLHLSNLNHTLKTAKVITPKEVEQSLVNYYANPYNKAGNYYNSNKEFGYYLAGLLEGDGHISLPSLGVTTLNRVLNPRIVFTSHINNLGSYAYIQSQLGGIGRFQLSGDNVIRYIIGDIKGITVMVNLISGKLRTPKNQRLNDLIQFINQKYCLNIANSILDISNMASNSWFAGFTDADGHFGVKIIEAKPKSDKRKRSVSTNISLRFRLDQRSYDKPNKTSMSSIMQAIATFLTQRFPSACVVRPYLLKPSLSEMLSLSVESIEKIGFLIDYFNKYPIIGVKAKDFNCWKEVYNLILTKEHLTEQGRLKIRLIADIMKKK
jgi:hypothetical protein